VSLINELIKSAKLAKQGKKVVVNPKPFFSAVDKAALDLQRAKGTGKEFMTEVKKTKGVKPTEVESRKLAQIEDMPKMTKDQFIDELEKRPPVKVSESVLPEGTSSIKDEYAQDFYDKDYYDLGISQREYIDNMLAKYGMDAQGQDYHLPGGENYREILLQLPHFSQSKVDELMEAEARLRRNPGNLLLARTVDALKAEKESYGEPYVHRHWGAENPNVLAHMRVQDRKGPNGEKILHVEEIQSDWHQKGRELRNQKIKEVMNTQKISKQEAEKLVSENYGYKDANAKINAKRALDDYDKDAKERLRQMMLQQAEPEMTGEKALKFVNNYVSTMDGSAVSNMLNEKTEWNRLYRTYHEAERGEGVPDSPFKKNWHELSMKRLLNYASENGYDGIAITPGAEQAKRYDLSKKIESVSLLPTDNGQYRIDAQIKGGGTKTETNLDAKGVEEMIGKELASRLISAADARLESTAAMRVAAKNGDDVEYDRLREARKELPPTVLSGLDLVVGGEGMAGFYDKMIPDYLNTFGKKYGVQTEMGGYKLQGDPSLRGDASERLGLAGQRFDEMTPQEIEAFNAKLDESNAKQLHYFKITPEMREEVKQGMPLYQQIGVPIGAGAAGAEIDVPQPAQEEEPTPVVQSTPFKHGGKVHVAKNSDTMFMELQDKKFKRK
jgi:hypothetical protein